MSVKIRLRRMGTRGKPFYRIVVADSRMSRDGRFIDLLGYYDPRTEPATVKIDEEKAVLWLNRGAQPTDTAEALLKKQNIFAGTVTADTKPRPERMPAETAVDTPEKQATDEPVTQEVTEQQAAEQPATEEEATESEPGTAEIIEEESPALQETEAEVEEERQSEEQG